MASIPTLLFNGVPGQPSTGTGGPDQIEADLAALKKVINPGDPGGGIDDTNIQDVGVTGSTKLKALSVTADKIADGAATDAKIGNRTVDQVQVPSGNTGTVTQLLSWVVNRIKDIKGTTNWYDASPDFVNVTGDTMSGDLEFQTNKAKFGSGKFSISHDGTNNALQIIYTP